MITLIWQVIYVYIWILIGAGVLGAVGGWVYGIIKFGLLKQAINEWKEAK